MHCIINQHFWQEVKIARAWRGYGPAYFLDLEDTTGKWESDKLVACIDMSMAKLKITKNEKILFDYGDGDGEGYDDSFLKELTGLRILSFNIYENNHAIIQLENNWQFSIDTSDSRLVKNRYWGIQIYRPVDVIYFQDHQEMIVSDFKHRIPKKKYPKMV